MRSHGDFTWVLGGQVGKGADGGECLLRWYGFSFNRTLWRQLLMKLLGGDMLLVLQRRIKVLIHLIIIRSIRLLLLGGILYCLRTCRVFENLHAQLLHLAIYLLIGGSSRPV